MLLQQIWGSTDWQQPITGLTLSCQRDKLQASYCEMFNICILINNNTPQKKKLKKWGLMVMCIQTRWNSSYIFFKNWKFSFVASIFTQIRLVMCACGHFPQIYIGQYEKSTDSELSLDTCTFHYIFTLCSWKGNIVLFTPLYKCDVIITLQTTDSAHPSQRLDLQSGDCWEIHDVIKLYVWMIAGYCIGCPPLIGLCHTFLAY